MYFSLNQLIIASSDYCLPMSHSLCRLVSPRHRQTMPGYASYKMERATAECGASRDFAISGWTCLNLFRTSAPANGGPVREAACVGL